MEEWKEYIVCDLGRIVTGKTPRTSIPENYGGKIPFLTPSDDLSGKYSPKTIKTITDTGLKEVKNCLLPSKSICVSCIGSDLGKVVITKEPTVTNQQFNSIIPNDKNDADYIYYLMTIVGKQLNYLSKTSTAVPIVNKSTFSSFRVKLPSKKVQHCIASILSSLDDKIEVNRKINENLEQQAQALFKSLFVDFEPFKNGEFVESELGMIPKGWRVAKFGDFIKVSTEKAPVDSFPEYSVTNNGIIPRDKKFNKKLSMSSSKNKVLRKDNLVFGMSREILNWGVMEDEVGGVSSAYNVYILNKEIISPTYLKLYMKARISDFNSLIGTAAREGQSLDKGQLIQMQIYIPSESTLQGFFNVYYPLTDKIQAVEDESRRLAELRDTLLPKLMSGELKVNEIVR
ncbi:MAG: restriction endonuclease subunit S [Bacteroidaceae bacterium]|nr:restriction endonuclease subunit S [Bacteroidaceae bacterium]